MKRKGNLPELLLPAGSPEALIAAVKGGADAVYLARERFGARAYARNFSAEELRQGVRYCHLHGVKVYLTLNTLLYNGELDEAVELARESWQMGVDALIISDVGLIRRIKKEGIKIPLHASTQMSVHNSLGAKEVMKLGCERVVLARELSYTNIALTTKASPIETEVFIHGALCVCHSGQCLFSSLVGGRSGNRGECAQPCRLPFDTGYTLSLSDLCLAGHIEALLSSGVASLKIEGRMKSPDYVFGVASIYRRLLDEGRNATKEEERKLKSLFSREGFTDGYFTGNKFSKMEGVRTEEDKERSREVNVGEYAFDKTPVYAKVKIRIGEPSELTLYNGEATVTVYGEVAAPAISAPLDEGEVKARLSKMGATLLSLCESDIELSLEQGANLSKKSLNELRRMAAEEFESLYAKPRLCSLESSQEEDFRRVTPTPKKTAVFYNASLYNSLSEKKETDAFDICFLPLDKLKVAGSVPNGIALPSVITEAELDGVLKMLEEAKAKGVRYALVSNIGHIPLIKELGLLGYGDFRLNITNKESLNYFNSQNTLGNIISAELDFKDLEGMTGGVCSFGRIPLMITERCYIRSKLSCKLDTSLPTVRTGVNNCLLKDRRGAEFPVLCEYGHRNVIFNSVPTYLGDMKDRLNRGGLGEHFIFSSEGVEEARELLLSYKKGEKINGALRRIGRRKS